MALKLSLLIQLTERVTAPVKRIRTSIRGMATDGERNVGRLDRAVGRLRSSLGRVGRGFNVGGMRSSLAGVIHQVRGLAGRAGMRGLEAASRGAASAVRTVGRAAAGIAIRAAAVTGAGVGFLGGWMTAGAIGVASKFEQFQVVLENTEGSAAKAKRAMDWVKEFGKTTPFEVEEVMEAFVKLKAYGFDPMDGTLRSLGDAASGMGKSLLDAVEMMADAQTGEFERLKEFGVRANADGKKVTFSYVKNGKTMTVTARKNATDIKRAITSIFDGKFAGMMDRQSRTMAGMWSNLKDSFTQFQLDIANAGLFDWLKGKLQSVLNKLTELAKSGKLKEWAEKISKWLEIAGEKAWKFATETNWTKLGQDLAMVGGAIRDVASAISWLTNVLKIYADIKDKLPDGSLLGGASVPTTLPKGGFNFGVDMGQRFANWLKSDTKAPPAASSARPYNPRANIRQLGAPVRQGNATQRPQRVETRTQVDLRIHTDRGTDARATKVATNDRGTTVNIHRAPQAAA